MTPQNAASHLGLFCLLTCVFSKKKNKKRKITRNAPKKKIDLPKSSLQCYSVLSYILVKNELCIPLESESSVLSTCNAFVCLSPPSKLKFAVLVCSIYKGLISFSAILF